METSKNNWKYFNLYEKGIALFFIFNIVFDVVNEKLLYSIVPSEILTYFFWLSLGLYLGFRLCKYEFKRIWDKINKNEQQENKLQDKI
jgi:hypothetical protein